MAKTIPATPDNLRVGPDYTPFHPRQEGDPPVETHRVLVDGHPGWGGIGTFGRYSLALVIDFDPPHPRFGEQFGTKYFRFDPEEPGLVHWGFEGETLRIELVVDDEAPAGG